MTMGFHINIRQVIVSALLAGVLAAGTYWILTTVGTTAGPAAAVGCGVGVGIVLTLERTLDWQPFEITVDAEPEQ